MRRDLSCLKAPLAIHMFNRMESHGIRRNRGIGSTFTWFSLTYPQVLFDLNHWKPSLLKKGFISYSILVQLFLRPAFKKVNPIISSQLPHFVEIHRVLVITKRFYNQPSDHHWKAGFCIVFVHIVLAFCNQVSCFSLHLSKKDNHDWIFKKFPTKASSVIPVAYCFY